MTKLLDLWQPPEGAGDAVGCFATTYTFEHDFFVDDCLTRFLGLTRVQGEGDTTSDVARMLDEEDRLSEAQVSVLVDRSCVPDKRNLRWDLLSVALGRGQLLHAKVAVLLWEHHTRVLLGSANLTPAGYRSQVEAVTALDLGDGCQIPGPVFRALSAELRALLAQVPGDPASAARARAARVLDRLEERVLAAALPEQRNKALRMAIAASKPGRGALDGLDEVWSGGPPWEVVALSPFWDGDSSARQAIVDRLAKRAPAGQKVGACFVVSVDPMTNLVRAPETLLDGLPRRMEVWATRLGETPGDDAGLRLLHAKCIRYESDTWTAAMVGSSNLTAAGLGLKAACHRELNLWIGCPSDSETAKVLRALIPEGDAIDLANAEFEPLEDEDELLRPALPACFVDALLHPGPDPRLELTVDVDALPARWEVYDGDTVLVERDDWEAAGSPTVLEVRLQPGALVSTLDVVWWDDGIAERAPWPVNVSDPSLLPPPDELRALPVDVLLAVLASTRPVHEALERVLRQQLATGAQLAHDELDALRRFDSGRLLLTRTRRVSAALWGLRARFDRPVNSLEALDWRLSGIVGVTQLADGLCSSAATDDIDAIEARFHLAELARTFGTIDWSLVAARLDAGEVRQRVAAALAHVEACCESLQGSPGAVDDYARAALESVRP